MIRRMPGPVLSKAELLDRLAEGHAARLAVVTPNQRLAQALRAGASDFLLKPFSVAQMLNAVQRCFERSMLRRENFVLRTDSDLAQIALLRAGAGIGGLQRQLAARDRDLVPVLHDAIRLPLEMWLVMHEDLRTTRRVRVLYDLLADELGAYVKGTNAQRRRSLKRMSS